MSNEQMAQSILQFTGGKGNIRIVSNCMTRVRLEVNDLSVVQIDQIKALKGVFGVHVDAQVQVIVGPGTAAKVAACLQELLGDAHKAAGQADKETAQEIAARNKQVIKSRQKVSKGKLFLKTISNVFVPLSSALIASGLLAGIQSILVSLTSTGALESTATVQSIITILMDSGFKVPEAAGKKAFLYEKGLSGEQFRAVLKKAQEERANGTRVAVAQMNKNKKFQKEQLAKDGYEEIVEFYKDSLK